MAICIAWHCETMQDPLGSKKVSLVSVLYIFSLALHLLFLIHPSFQSGTNYNIFGGKMHVPGNCLPHSASSAYAYTVLPVVLLLVYLNLDIWTQSMFKQTGENSFLAHFRSRNKMCNVLLANLRLYCIIFSIRSNQLNCCFTRQVKGLFIGVCLSIFC